MILKIVALFAICCFASLVSGAEEPRSQRFRQVFFESDPPQTRDQTLKLVKDLKESYLKDKPSSDKIKLINEVLARSEVSRERCKSFSFWGGEDSKFSGHAKQLVKNSIQLQINMCKEIWETSLLRSIDTIDKDDKDAVSSLMDSMVEANSGQEGVLRFIESKNGWPFSKKTLEAEFNDDYDKYVDVPCGKITDKLTRVAEEYIFLLRISGMAKELNPTASKWAKNNMVCRQLRGNGMDSYRSNIFNNLVGGTKKRHWF